MKCPIASDPPFDDLKPLKGMPGCAGRARVGTGRDNKSWSRIGFGFGSQDTAHRHAMLITRCGKAGGGANFCRNVPAAKKNAAQYGVRWWQTSLGVLARQKWRPGCFPRPIPPQVRPDSGMRPRGDDRLQSAFDQASLSIYRVVRTR